MASARNFGELYELLSRGAGWMQHLKPEAFRVTPIPERSDLELEILDTLCEGPRTIGKLAAALKQRRSPVRNVIERFHQYGWVSQENIGSEVGVAWRYTITDTGRRAAMEPCLPPKGSFADNKRDNRRRLPRTDAPEPQPHRPQVPAMTAINSNEYMRTIARWIRLADLPEESGPCETIGGVTIPPRRSSRPAKTNHPSWKALDLDSDPRVPEALQMRDDGRTVAEICEALQMHHSSLKKILAARKEG